MAVQLANRSECQLTPDSPTARSISLARPVLSAKMLPKMRAVAAGATTKGSSTLIRHQVRPRSGVSSMAAITVAMTTCGTDGEQEDADGVPEGLVEHRVGEHVDVVVEPDARAVGRPVARPGEEREVARVDHRVDADGDEEQEERQDVEVRARSGSPSGRAAAATSASEADPACPPDGRRHVTCWPGRSSSRLLSLVWLGAPGPGRSRGPPRRGRRCWIGDMDQERLSTAWVKVSQDSSGEVPSSTRWIAVWKRPRMSEYMSPL